MRRSWRSPRQPANEVNCPAVVAGAAAAPGPPPTFSEQNDYCFISAF